MAEHRNLTGASLHECKGADTASAGTVPVADGAGSTDWQLIALSNINTSSVLNLNKYQLTTEIADISTADIALMPVTKASTLTKVTVILHAAITTANSTITVINSTGPVTIGIVSVLFTGSGEGSQFSLTPSSSNTFSAGSYVKLSNDGGSSTAVKATIVLDFTQTG